MAHYGEQRHFWRGQGGAGSERPFEEDRDRGDRQRFEADRDRQRYYGGSERFGAEGDRRQRDEYPHGDERTSYDDDADHRGYGRGQHERREEAHQQLHPRYGHGSGYGGYGRSPGEAGGSYDSGRSYSAEPGWGPGYGERRHRLAAGGSSYGEGQWHAGASEGGTPGGERWQYGGGGVGMQRDHGRAGTGGGTQRYSGGYGFDGSQGGDFAQHARHELRGPKGYQRSDERLKEDICERLMSMGHYVDASDVSLDVKDGKVTLEGTVPERRMKHAIEDVVDECMGVKDIDNHIRVNREQRSSGASGEERTRMSIGGGSQASISGMGEGTSAGHK